MLQAVTSPRHTLTILVHPGSGRCCLYPLVALPTAKCSRQCTGRFRQAAHSPVLTQPRCGPAEVCPALPEVMPFAFLIVITPEPHPAPSELRVLIEKNLLNKQSGFIRDFMLEIHTAVNSNLRFTLGNMSPNYRGDTLVGAGSSQDCLGCQN